MESIKHLIILGPPGSGKGTQAKMIQDKFSFVYFGTGDLMRQEAEKGSEIGRKFQAIWDKGQGELIPDELVDEFVNFKLREIDAQKSIIFDGYPRTVDQAENLSRVLNITPDNLYVLNIEVPKDLLVERMQTRKVCQKCGQVFFRPDEKGIKACDDCGDALLKRQEDQPETMEKRILVYQTQTQPLIEYYKSHATLINIDGSPSINLVEAEIEEKLSGVF